MRERGIVFAGQGAQFVGMGKDLAAAYPDCRALFDRADETLGYSLSGICFEGPEEELIKSNHCQPAIFVTSVACHKALCLELGDVNFKGTAGLSLGEWSALHVAGALTFEDTLRVLEARGRFMQDACEERDGAMMSVIGLTVEKARAICDEAGVEISNLNSPEQTVLAGERGGIEKAEQLAKQAGAKRTVILKVAGAYHSALMKSAAVRLEEALADVNISDPDIPALSNVTGKRHEGAASIRRDMVGQVTRSVQWVSCVEWFKSHGVTEYVECGPGRVLSGLIKRIDREAILHNVQDVPSLRKTVEAL